MLIVISVSTWMNNILAAIAAFIYYNVITGVISTIHILADGGVIGNNVVRDVFDVLYWHVPHQLVSTAVRDLSQAEIQISAVVENNQALATIPSPSSAGGIAWWGVTV